MSIYRRESIIWIFIMIGLLQVIPVSSSSWNDYKVQVDSIFQSMDSLNARVRAIHINYSEKLISLAEAVTQMEMLAPRYQEVETRADAIKPPPQWEKYHETFLKIIRLTVESTEDLKRYFESEDETYYKKSLDLIQQAAENFRNLSLMAPLDEDPPKILSVQMKPTNPAANQPVELTVNATDFQTGFGRVVINYSINSGDWTTKGMQLISGSDSNGVWKGSIPGQDPGSKVIFYVVVIDRSGNIAKSEFINFDVFDLSLFVPLSILACIVILLLLLHLRKKRSRKECSARTIYREHLCY